MARRILAVGVRVAALAEEIAHAPVAVCQVLKDTDIQPNLQRLRVGVAGKRKRGKIVVALPVAVLALVVRVLPVYITKQQLDTYAVELVREAEIAGRVGTETTRRAAALTDSTGLDPDIRWSTTGRIQLNDEVTVTLTLETDIGLFGGFGSFPITLTASATGKSEVYWK